MTDRCQGVEVTGGVDTHAETHHAAALDSRGRVLGDREFTATAQGYVGLLAWLAWFGPVTAVGVEGTGSYGVGLTRHLGAQGVTVIEVNRPDRAARRAHGKSDPLDAIAAARAVQSGRATATPKTGTGPVAAIKALHQARAGAVKHRTAALNQLTATIVTAPETLRAQLRGLSAPRRVTTCAALPHDPAQLVDPHHATAAALRSIATRIQHLDTEIAALNTHLDTLTATIAPATRARLGVGPITTAQMLTTAGDNPDRLHSEAALAHLCGAAPIPASSGRTDKHRLNRGGDRHANAALHRIAIVRMRWHQPTRDYITRRTTEGLTKKDIIRCLKRHIARELFHTIRKDLATTRHL